MAKVTIKNKTGIIYIVIGILIVIALLILSVYKNTHWYVGIFAGGITYICMLIYLMVNNRWKNTVLILIGLAIVSATLIVSFYNNYNIFTFYNNFYSFFFTFGISLSVLGILFALAKTISK